MSEIAQILCTIVLDKTYAKKRLFFWISEVAYYEENPALKQRGGFYDHYLLDALMVSTVFVSYKMSSI